MSLLKLIIFLLLATVGLLFIWISSDKKKYNKLRKLNNNYAIQLDSLRAENRKAVSQLQYLEKYYDSTKKKIPEPKGFAFIGDSVTNPGK